jgi:N-acetylglucosamine kinase-like BadF-type ATPase
VSHASLVLGIDGGGSKTEAWLAALDDVADGGVLGRGRAGPGNPRAVGFEAAEANILAAIEAAFADAGLPRAAVAAACFGLAGAGREEEQQRIVEWAEREGVAYMLRVTGDAEPVLAAASSDNCGIALVCGTGSFAWGRNRTGETARCGGWGYLVGDEGSGYEIARAGLIAAFRAADGRGPETSLLPAFLTHFRASVAGELVQRLYAPEMTRQRLAELAKIVFVVQEDDAVARKIIASAADDLAELVAALARRLGLIESGYSLAMTGGVTLNQRLLCPLLLARLAHRGCLPAYSTLVESPAAGAVALARQVARR